jgi:hypothetical protein
MEVTMSIAYVFERLALNLAFGEMWGRDNQNVSLLVRDLTRQMFRSQAYGIVDLLSGTSLSPADSPRKEYMGVTMPEDWIAHLKRNPEVFPSWYRDAQKVV